MDELPILVVRDQGTDQGPREKVNVGKIFEKVVGRFWERVICELKLNLVLTCFFPCVIHHFWGNQHGDHEHVSGVPHPIIE